MCLGGVLGGRCQPPLLAQELHILPLARCCFCDVDLLLNWVSNRLVRCLGQIISRLSLLVNMVVRRTVASTKMPLARGPQPDIESALILHHNLVIVVIEVRFVAVLRALAQHSLAVLAVIEAHEVATRGVVLPGVVALSLLLVHIDGCQDYRWRRVIDVRVMLHLIEGRQRIRHRVIVRVEVLVLVRLHRCIIRAGKHIVVIHLLFVPGDHSMTPRYETASA